jgi:hypothetical protein
VRQLDFKVDLDGLEVLALKPDVAEQPDSPQIAQKFKARVLLGPDHMNMRRAMIVREDHHSPAIEVRENGWHGAI